jgi:aspartate aminotransferase
MTNSIYSEVALCIGESITHGARMRIAQLNKSLTEQEQVIDLSIGTLDTPTHTYIDNGVIEFIREKPELIHQFAPVKGFEFLRASIADRTLRLNGMLYNPDTEIMVTPGGIKGSLAIAFHTLLNPADEVVVPLPNWPHYADMIRLHGGKPVFVQPEEFLTKGLTASDLENAISAKTKIVILGDCINPTGKVYSDVELTELAGVIASKNRERERNGKTPIVVLYDCPYEAHILENKPRSFASIEVDGFAMRPYVISVTGPGKTYGMHGDRIGYICAPKAFIDVAANVQVNLNSFACTYGQVACYYATHTNMDEVARARAAAARANALDMIEWLRGCDFRAHTPQGGYFIFANLSKYEHSYREMGFETAEQFLLESAKVATISGEHFAEGYERASQFRNFVRINCGRDRGVLATAAERIKNVLSALR